MLKHYLRRMVNDMIKIEIDSKFPKPRKSKRYEKITKKRTLGNKSPPNRQQSASLESRKIVKRKLSYSKNMNDDSESPEKSQTILHNDTSKISLSRHLT